ncbi:T9SS type A sorting domain-containing protein [Soonwooa sp.]|uniref:T9SS type A sorting domain-containing protein n=1 Tax=Soonwooa sp. TaxID=1938592 RepID=UPI00263A0BBA|nr:T9SS type A sorting domain-containing protein [Soonwooa sp.]
MKKVLFSLIATTAVFYSVNAQTSKVSFEASEGFSLGELVGQSTTVRTFYADGVGVQEVAEITSENASDGVNSVKILNADDEEDGGIFITNVPSFNKTSVTFDVLVPEFGGSDNFFILFAGEKAMINMDFNYQGNVKIGNFTTSQYETKGTYTAGQWTKVRVDIDFGAKTLKYFVNNSLIHTQTTTNTGTTIDEMDFYIDNYGSDAYFDNIQVRDTTTLAVADFTKNVMSVYPNPTAEVLNFGINEKINTVEIFDANGRLVKTVKDSATSVDVSALPKGNYVVKVATDKANYTNKIIKK